MEELITVQFIDSDTKNFTDGEAEIEAVSSEPQYEVYDSASSALSDDYGGYSRNSKWNNKKITLMLDLRLGMEEQFINPVCRKNKLWEEISSQMINYGYNLSATDCHDKYRNLLQTYKQNKQKSLKTGKSKIVWEFFDLFDAVLGTKSSNLLINELASSSIDENSEAEPKRNPKVKDNKKKNEVSLAHYLYLKNKKQAEAQQKVEERWKEKKELKEMEIDAINNLAKAILGTNVTAKRKRNNLSDSE